MKKEEGKSERKRKRERERERERKREREEEENKAVMTVEVRKAAAPTLSAANNIKRKRERRCFSLWFTRFFLAAPPKYR